MGSGSVRGVPLSVLSRCPGNSRNPALLGLAAAVGLDQVPAGGAESAQWLHDPARVLTGAHGDLREGVTVPPVHQGTGLPVLGASVSVSVPLSLTLPVPLSLHGGRVRGVEQGVAHR